MSPPVRVSPAWLSLREEADAAARAPELLDPLLRHLRRPLPGAGAGRAPRVPAARDGSRAEVAARPTGASDGSRAEVAARPTGASDGHPGSLPPLVVCDLGCGTGAMGRWLAGRLPGPQHWVMYDRDPELLDQTAGNMVGTAADGTPVTMETRQRDITTLTAADLTGAALVTASAVLDLLTHEEVHRLVAACVGAACPALLTLSVAGRVELTPADPLDEAVAAAFNAHQRRRAGGRRLLGPDAVDAAAEAFTQLGATVRIRPSPWRPGPDQAALTCEWLRGWVAAACLQRSALAAPGAAYLARRLAAAAAGELKVEVGHSDLLAYVE